MKSLPCLLPLSIRHRELVEMHTALQLICLYSFQVQRFIQIKLLDAPYIKQQDGHSPYVLTIYRLIFASKYKQQRLEVVMQSWV